MRGAIFNGAHRLAHLEFKILQQRRQLGFQFARAVAQLHITLAGKLGALLVKRVLLLACGLSILFKLRQLLVQAVEEPRNIHLLRAQPLARRDNDACVEAQPLRGLDAGGRPRHSEPQLIVGNQRHFIHAGRCIQHAGSIGGVDLERRVVRGDQRPRTRGEKKAGHCDGESRAFFRIGGRSQLVQQHQRIRIRKPREAIEVGDVRGEGRQRCLNGLRVANVGEEGVKDRKTGSGGGDRQPCLRHHGQQRRSLERNGFSACVGAADNELAVFVGQLQREGNNARVMPGAGRAQTLLQQRMPRCFEVHDVGRHGGGHAVVVACEAGASLQAVDQGEHARAFHQRLGVAAHLAGEGDKDAVNLALLLFQQSDQFVVLLDGFQRLHINSEARRACPVHYARDAPLELCANGNHEAVAANGDDIVLRGAVRGELAQRGAKALFNLALLAFLVAANPAQLRRRVVGERAVRLNLALDRFGQWAQAA